MNISFRRSFELKDNGDLTQNLYSKCYQNNLLISEIDLGNIEDIVCLKKENKDLKEKLEQKSKVIEEIKEIVGKHTYTQKDDYYDYCEQGISLVDSDDDYDKLLDILNKGVDE